MISVQSLLKADRYHIASHYLTGSVITGSPYSWVLGPVILALPKKGDRAKYGQKWLVPVEGIFLQGHQSYGKLRDKGVIHSGARGELTVSGETLASTPVSSNNIGLQGLLFPKKTGGSQAACGIAAWGNDVTFTGAFRVPTHTVSGKVYSDIVFDQEIIVRFDGPYCIVEMHMGPRKVSADGQPLATAGETWTCSFYRMVYGSYAMPTLYGSQTYTASMVNGAWRYSFPNASIVAGQAFAAPSSYGVGVGSKLLDYDQWKLGLDLINSATDAEILTKAEVVARLLDGRNFISEAEEVFGRFPANTNWGDLGQDIVQQQDYVDTSALLTVFDLAILYDTRTSWKLLATTAKKLATQATDIAVLSTRFFSQTAKSIRLAKNWSKLLSSGYLSVLYGILPPIRDVQKIQEGMKKLYNYASNPRRMHSRRRTVVSGPQGSAIATTSVVTAEVTQLDSDFLGELMKEIEFLHRVGLWPTTEMLWDVIPFSFVVDWVVNIGDFWERTDLDHRVQYLPIDHVIYSEKRSWAPKLTLLWPGLTGVSGVVEFTYYSRYIEPTLTLPPVVLEGSSTPPMTHWLEAAALTMQRL